MILIRCAGVDFFIARTVFFNCAFTDNVRLYGVGLVVMFVFLSLRLYKPDAKNAPWVSHADLNMALLVNPASGPDSLLLVGRHVNRSATVNPASLIFQSRVSMFENGAVQIPTSLNVSGYRVP